MRNPKNVLESLTSKAASKDYHYQRLYRNLYNPAFYLLAYERIQAKPGNMTAGSDGKTIDGMSMKRIEVLIQKLKDFSYQPKPARRTYIPKANGKTRPLGIPSFDDKLVQEVVRMILERAFMNPPFTLLPMDSAQSGAVIRLCNISSGTTRGSNGLLRVISKDVLITLTIMCWCRYCAGALRMSISSA